jgi:ribosomal protein S6E (S10)
MAKRNTRNRSYKRKNMRGGAFSQEEIQMLNARGLADDQIEILNNLNISFNEVMQAINTIMEQNDPGNSDDMAEQVMNILTNGTPPNEIQGEDEDSFVTNGTMTLDELNTSGDTDASGYTSEEDTTGGKRRRRLSRKMKSKRKNGKKSRKTKKRKQSGGTCYGKGVGANSYDPNYSIYNTNMLKLFPYRTN